MLATHILHGRCLQTTRDAEYRAGADRCEPKGHDQYSRGEQADGQRQATQTTPNKSPELTDPVITIASQGEHC